MQRREWLVIRAAGRFDSDRRAGTRERWPFQQKFDVEHGAFLTEATSHTIDVVGSLVRGSS
jgi:hypothetical protein